MHRAGNPARAGRQRTVRGAASLAALWPLREQKMSGAATAPDIFCPPNAARVAYWAEDIGEEAP
ncbi:hypothetical protein [Curtobacterium aurantiacum]|uniref:hypothetical protein n=1 Tax=Curtobacterium aurantiacum TaxID=3236919 RepID=UPI001BDF648F|nr:hypothetical protein [Curtobacterium flaccumfaciens]MBT1680534.1 hypothetical protein [Curtobacterium flaccumfaciens pv. flaccumfaciens]